MCLAVLGGPSPARADWLLTPFVGVKLDGNTNLVDLDQGAGAAKVSLGGSVALLGNGLFGVEADVGIVPAFFSAESTRGPLVTSSVVTTVTGNVIIAVPVGLTRESLRPFVLGGLGWMHVSLGDVLDVFRLNNNYLALDFGAGAMGGLSPRTGLRFEVRRFQNLTREQRPGLGFGPTRLSFWRADVGLTLRY